MLVLASLIHFQLLINITNEVKTSSKMVFAILT